MSITVAKEQIQCGPDSVWCHATLPVDSDNARHPVTLFVWPAHLPEPPMGSFVYALPYRGRPEKVICTRIFLDHGSIDGAERLAKTLAVKLNRPVYVGSSLGGGDGSVEASVAVVQWVTQAINQTDRS